MVVVVCVSTGPPVTQPEVPPTVAIALEAELQLPPADASVRHSSEPAQTGEMFPLMPVGSGLTVTTVYAAQPVGNK